MRNTKTGPGANFVEVISNRMSFFSKIFGDVNARYIKNVQSVTDEINKLEPKFGRFSDEELREYSFKLKKQVSESGDPDAILIEAFAAVREAARRTLNQRHFDVQLIGGIALHQGQIAEMKTGEGKTLTATLPVYLNALSGKGVHIITVNDYLARRDTAWMGQIYHALGLSVGCINHDESFIYDPSYAKASEGTAIDKERDITGAFKVVHDFLRPVTRREAYEADITYGTNNEYGFDYLRDNMVYDLSQKVQAKGHNFAIIDEVDSILIDEARTPLIISAPDADSGKLYERFAKIVPNLLENEDYNVDEKLKAVSITEGGIEKVEKILGVANIYEEGGTRYVHHLEQALKAQVLFARDRDYVVKNGEVIIVDEFTGRLMPGRRWSEGLHQAIEAKEGVRIEKESRTLATITFQNYFRLYAKLSGMTGTAATSAEEFHKVYNIDVVRVPTNKPMVRVNLPDRVYKTENGKFKAITEEIKERHEKGQPVLVGTVSIQKNELLSAMLSRAGVPHEILNAKNHEREAEIIAQAGKLGAVTVATNMAGRGVDIILGGNPPNPEQGRAILKIGGLHVIGTERHEARRIDNQLRGRAGRQGDPGSSQFFVSAEDEVIRIFGGDRLKNIMDRLGVKENEAIENRFVSKAIEQAQGKIEGHYFDMRKYVLEYDDVMNRHRKAIYDLRNKILGSQNVKDITLGYIEEEIEKIVRFHTQSPDANTEEIAESVKALISPAEMPGDLHSRLIAAFKSGNYQDMKDYISGVIGLAYESKEKDLGEEQMRRLEKLLLLRIIDELWVDHLEAMEYLRDSVRLRAYGQRDPLVEYKIEGQKMFEQLMDGLKAQAANLIFKVGIVRQSQFLSAAPSGIENRGPSPASPELGRGRAIPLASGTNQSQIERELDKNTPTKPSTRKIGRNDPCPCGARHPDNSRPIKYKHCHGKNA